MTWKDIIINYTVSIIKTYIQKYFLPKEEPLNLMKSELLIIKNGSD